MLDKHLIPQMQPVADPKNVISFGKYRITVLTDRLFRIEKGVFCDEATQTVWFRDMPAVKYNAVQDGGTLRITTGYVTLGLTDEISSSYVIIDGKRTPLTNEGNFLGTYRTLDACDGADYVDTRLKTRTPIQLGFGVASSTGVAVYDDSASLIIRPDGTLCERPAQTDLYVFAYGKDYRGALRALYTICGKTPVIPRYALGNWWSRYHAYTDREYLQVMDRLAKRRIPVTVATVDMDWHWSTTTDEHFGITASGKNDDLHGCSTEQARWGLGWTGYSWNTDLFPDYKRFLRELKGRGLHVTLNLHPALGVRFFEDCYKDMAQAMDTDPATEQQIPFDFTSDKFINAYFKVLHKPYEHDGVDFWWIDWQQGFRTALSGLDPLWALNHYHTLDNAKEHAPLILSRYAGIGSHRYPLGFSGDTFVTWETLDYLPYFTANATNAGFTWWSHDIGGHMLGYKDDELYVRFIQFGVFSPVNRLHCTDSVIATKEPFVYTNGTGLIAEEFLRLRHRLIPYLWSASYENTYESNRALIEPLYYAYPDNREAYSYRNEYLFGSQLLVAPITHKGDNNGMASQKVWLPEGHWTDVFTGHEYDGGREITVVRRIDTIPVFAREGAIFVLDGRDYTNDTSEPDILDVNVYSGTGAYTLYEDNDAHTDFMCETVDGIQRINIISCGAVKRTCRVHFPHIRRGEAVILPDGAVCDYDTDGYMTVTFELGEDNAVRAEIRTSPETHSERRNRMLLYSMIRIQGDHRDRANLLRDLFSADDSLCRRLIDDCTFLSDNEKLSLKEALYCE